MSGKQELDFRFLVLMLIALVCLYVGAGGLVKADLEITIRAGPDKGGEGYVVYKGVSFKSVDELQAMLQQERAYEFFPWIPLLPAAAASVLTALAFGALGGVVRAIHIFVKETDAGVNQPVMIYPLFGGLIGVLVLGVSYLVPAILTSGESNLRPGALLFLCMFGGIFSDRVYDYVEHFVDERFKRT